jgi:hypothetical protein
VLIRDPLARFISGYAAIEKELRQKEAEGLAMEDPEKGLETFGDIWRPWNIMELVGHSVSYYSDWT